MNKFFQNRRKLITSFLVIFISLLTSFIIVIRYSNVEYNFYDMLYNNFRENEVEDDPVIVAIDQNTLNYFRNSLHIIWPWPRDIYQPIVNYLDACDAKAIAFDILFTSPGIDRMNVDGSLTDSIFARTMNLSGKTTVAMQFEDSTLTLSDELVAGYLEKEEKTPARIYHQYDKASLPIPVIQNNTELLGAVNIPSASSGIIRKLPLLFEYHGKVIPHLSLSTYMLAHDVDKIEFDETNNKIIAGQLQIPVDHNGNYFINWYGEGGVNSSFKYYSFANLLKSAVQYQRGLTPVIPPRVFREKAVFIGAVAAGLLDMKSTPVSASDPYPGIEIYATMYKNFIKKDFIHTFPVFFWFIILFGFLIIKTTVWQSERFVPATIVSSVLILLPLALSIYLFRYHEILFPVIAFEAGLFLNLVLSVTIEYFWAGKTNRKLRKNFSRYLEPRLVKMIADSPDSVETAGNEVIATVLFSDIKDFTNLSETLSSQKVVNLLNQYFEEGERVIFNNKGMLDKYTGDGLMALFGVPVPDKDHAISACNAIMEFNKLKNIEMAGREFNLVTRIGVHTGPFVAGNIGSSRRVDFTAIGSTVNIAARLEQVNKVFNTNNIISAETCDLVNNYFVCRDLDYYRVKGIEHPLHIYTVLCKKEDINWEIEELMTLHQKGLAHYRAGKLKDAGVVFQKILGEFPNDKVSEYFLKKCQ